MRSWSLWLAGIALLPVMLLAAYLALERNAVRQQLTAWLSAETGRRIQLGEVTWALAPLPTLVVRDIEVGNPSWGRLPALLRVDRLEGRVALRPLLRGELVIPSLTLSGSHLWLERDADGNGNWRWHDTTDAADSAAVATPVIARLEARDLKVHWLDPDTAQTRTAALARLVLEGVGASTPLAIDAASEAGDGLPGWALAFSLQQDAGGYRIDDLVARLGGSDLTGTLHVAVAEQGIEVSGQLASAQLDLSDWRGHRTVDDTPTRVFSDRPVSWYAPSSWRLAVDYRLERLLGTGPSISAVTARIEAADGVLLFDQFSARAGGGALRGLLRVDTNASRPRLRFVVRGTALPLAEWLPGDDRQRWLDAQGEFDLQGTASGHSPAALLADLDGSARLLVGPGTADLRDLDTLVGGLAVAISTLAEDDAEQARLNCAAASFDISRGVATGRLLLADTEYSTVRGTGAVDLRDERLDLLLTPSPKSLSINVAVPVRIGGRLAAPTYTPQETAVARRGIGLLAAVGAISFPPAAVLGLVDLGSGDDNPCLELAMAAAPDRVQTDAAPTALERVGHDVGQALSDIGGAIEGLFD